MHFYCSQFQPAQEEVTFLGRSTTVNNSTTQETVFVGISGDSTDPSNIIYSGSGADLVNTPVNHNIDIGQDHNIDDYHDNLYDRSNAAGPARDPGTYQENVNSELDIEPGEVHPVDFDTNIDEHSDSNSFNLQI